MHRLYRPICSSQKSQRLGLSTSFLSVSVIFIGLLLATPVNTALAEKRTLEEIIPFTKANLRGHKNLYKDGWSVITSSEKALTYAYEHSITSSAQALIQLKEDLKQDTSNYAKNLIVSGKDGAESSKQIFTEGTQRTKDLFTRTHKLGASQFEYGKASFIKAWDKFSYGYLYYGERTEEDFDSFKAIPGDYYSHLKRDFSNIAELSQSMNDALSTDIRADWPGAMKKAVNVFKQEYETSGESGNSIIGLGHIILGYGKSIYQALFKPAAETAFMVGEYTVRVGAQTIFLPLSSVVYFTGNTIQSTGLTLYYVSKGVVKLVSPTIEGGFYAATAVVSTVISPITYTTGTTAGIINQVASTAAAPVAGVIEGVAKGVVATIKYPVVMTYDIAVGTTKVVVNQAMSGVVLGYNALTALPAHMIMAVPNSLIFIFWDGPRLVMAYAMGEVKDDDGEGQNIDALPVGTMLNVGSLAGSEGITIAKITDDPDIIKKVLEGLAYDLSTK